jgi:hypothetical protein
MDPLDVLSPDETRVLSVYRLRGIRPGYGLTQSTFSKELHGRDGLDLPAVLESLQTKGMLATHPHIHQFFLLTARGYRRLNES